MKNNEFWVFFDSIAAPQLAHREKTFRKIFEYLDSIHGPLVIVETGCARLANNWAGDGQSTVMFDKYITTRDTESVCFTVDINPQSVSACKNLVSKRVSVNQDDSVHYLTGLNRHFTAENKTINFLYLDSFDLDMQYWFPSAAHHLKEMLAIFPCVDEKTLVVVDDCPLNVNFLPGENQQVSFLTSPEIGGKGRLVAEFASAAEATLLFAEYQAGWVGFNKQ
ncbi:hypothetical protein [Polynucleobacter sp. UK-Gri1-W3]|uniref:hypothetical protein n=1 Tax=Polynucleobacter sp. UK-Gri1-W3 TaxID=1819737 RepID=UPI001C0CC807|nr:hypothetical protein [Polynucleobacter sp. UK-Gri1-W3]MBU3539426.1 hypothetical protein [Polynucleobacter sp. UK-Gri1-W3]